MSRLPFAGACLLLACNSTTEPIDYSGIPPTYINPRLPLPLFVGELEPLKLLDAADWKYLGPEQEDVLYFEAVGQPLGIPFQEYLRLQEPDSLVLELDVGPLVPDMSQFRGPLTNYTPPLDTLPAEGIILGQLDTPDSLTLGEGLLKGETLPTLSLTLPSGLASVQFTTGLGLFTLNNGFSASIKATIALVSGTDTLDTFGLEMLPGTGQSITINLADYPNQEILGSNTVMAFTRLVFTSGMVNPGSSLSFQFDGPAANAWQGRFRLSAPSSLEQFLTVPFELYTQQNPGSPLPIYGLTFRQGVIAYHVQSSPFSASLPIAAPQTMANTRQPGGGGLGVAAAAARRCGGPAGTCRGFIWARNPGGQP